ncbi:lasso RiPP family leader peptide-containing protein [Paenarthrobacter sp. NPDC089714]
MENTYYAPRVARVGSFRKVTNGYWFGRWRDIFGGHAFIKITIG